MSTKHITDLKNLFVWVKTVAAVPTLLVALMPAALREGVALMSKV